MNFTCIIVDDEPLSHDVVKAHLRAWDNIDVVSGFFNARDAAQFLEKEKVDILFLDIEMPEISGIEFLRSLDVKPVTIMTTAYRDFALEGFELGVIDYLLKPITAERFDAALKRATEFLNLARLSDKVDFSNENGRSEILIKSGTKRILIDYKTIRYAQGLKDYTILHTQDKKYVVKGSVKAFEDFLPGDFFLRVHRSFIIAKHKIKIVKKNRIEFDGMFIPIGRTYKAAIEQILQGRH